MREESEPIREIDEQIENWYAQWTLIDRIYIDYCHQLEISSTGLSVLRFIKEKSDGCTQHDICTFFYLPKQTVSSILSQLEKKGQIQKLPSSKDRRSAIIQLTPSGERMVCDIMSDLRKKEEKAFEVLTVKDRRELTRLNKLLTKAMQENIIPYNPQK